MPKPTDDQREDRVNLIKILDACMDKPSIFAKTFLKIDLFPYQVEYADCKDRFIVCRQARQSGKTTTTAIKTIHFAWFADYLHELVKTEADITQKAICNIVIVAPTQNQANIMFGRIRDLIHTSDILEQYVIREKSDEIHLRFASGRGVTKIFTRAAGDKGTSLRGYSPHVIIADECAFLKEEVLAAFMPAGLATNARVWLTSTPFSPVGYFYEACADSRPRKPDGKWREFHVKAMDNPFVRKDPEYYEQIKTKMTKDKQMMELEAEFLDVGDSFIPRQLIVDAMSDNAKNGVLPVIIKYYMGVDVSRAGKDETAFVIIGVDDHDNCYLVTIYTESLSNIVDLKDKIGQYIKMYNVQTVYIDETGIGCMLQGTEILTGDGWKKIEDITLTDKIYSKNKEGYAVLSNITKLTKYENKKSLECNGYVFSESHLIPSKTRKEHPMKLRDWKNTLDLDVMYFDTEFNYDSNKELVLDLPEYRIDLPNGGTGLVKPPIKLHGDIFARFLGWYLSEGNTDNSNGYSIHISQSSKGRHNPKIVDVLNKLGFKYNIRKSKSGELTYRLFDKRLYNWLRENCYDGLGFRAPNKKIPQILRECRKQDMLSFFEAYRDGDGWIHKHSNEFASSSKKLMDDIHELIIKTGGYCNTRMRVKKGSETTIEGRKMIRKHDVFGVYQWKDNIICLSTKNDINEVFGNIYDLVVDSDTHLIYNRMPNGRSLWSHNGGLVDLCLKENYPVRGVVFSLEEQEQLYENLRLLFENHRIYLRGERRIADQLAYLKIKFTEGNKMRVVSEQADDLADALTLACKAVESGGRVYLLPSSKAIFG